MKIKVKGVEVKLSLINCKDGTVDLVAEKVGTGYSQIIAYLDTRTGEWDRPTYVSEDIPFVREAAELAGKVAF